MLGFGQRIGRARHAFHATGNENLAFASADGARRHVDRAQTGSAQPVDGDTGRGNRQAGQQQCHAGHVAVILASLVGAAQVNFFNQRSIKPGAGQQRSQYMGSQVVGADFSQHAAQCADGGAHSINDNNFGHANPSGSDRHCFHSTIDAKRS